MKKLVLCGALALLAASASACITHAAIVSTDKKAYVFSGNLFGTNLYHCTAESGRPVCTQVIEEGKQP